MKRLGTALALAFACATALPALAADVVKLGVLNSSGDLPFVIAEAKGYFRDENLDVRTTVFQSAARMIAPLGTGDLDAGGGTATAGLYNAASRKVEVKLVASRGRTAPGYQYQTVVIRKDLIDNGRVKTWADMKGLKFGMSAEGIGPQAVIGAIAQKGGFPYKEIEQVFLAFPQQVTAFQNKAIDGSVMIEPYGTFAVSSGAAVHFAPSEEIYPGQEVSMVTFGEKFARERPDAARRFMKAFLRAVRDYNDAITEGRWNNSKVAEEIIGYFSKTIDMPVEKIRQIQPQAIDPNGAINMTALRNDLDFFKAQGLVESKTTQPEDIVDRSFVEAAAQELGPYKRAP